MRRAAKLDRNQPEIVEALRGIGASVESLAAVGHGVSDLLVGFRQRNLLLEIKDGRLAPSRRVLTPDQVLWHAQWRGTVYVVETVEQAIEAVMRT